MPDLTITFTPVPPVPTDGYIVKYREVGTSEYITLSPNPTLSPIIISVPNDSPYEGIISTSCSNDTVAFTSGTVVNCGGALQYNGGPAFPSYNTITLGNGVGTVTLNYNAYDAPDKFIVYFDGVEVINTGYRGDTSYQTDLDTALTDLGLPTETIASPGAGTVSFTKATSTSTAAVFVYAPLESTIWTFTLGCPQ